MMSFDRRAVRRQVSFFLAFDLKRSSQLKKQLSNRCRRISPSRNQFGMPLANAKEDDTRRRLTEGCGRERDGWFFG
jgi:hypothetical protein